MDLKKLSSFLLSGVVLFSSSYVGASDKDDIPSLSSTSSESTKESLHPRYISLIDHYKKILFEIYANKDNVQELRRMNRELWNKRKRFNILYAELMTRVRPLVMTMDEDLLCKEVSFLSNAVDICSIYFILAQLSPISNNSNSGMTLNDRNQIINVMDLDALEDEIYSPKYPLDPEYKTALIRMFWEAYDKLERFKADNL